MRSGYRCEPDCTCGRHTQYRWTGLTFEARFWSKVSRGHPDECWPWAAGRSDAGYGNFWASGRTLKAHRVAYELLTGPIPPGMEVDHRCHNRGCVNPAHLRLVTGKQNVENHQGPRRDSKSGVRGVYLKPNGKFCAGVRHGGKYFHIGYFDLLCDAEAAVLAARLRLHSHNDFDRAPRDGVANV